MMKKKMMMMMMNKNQQEPMIIQQILLSNKQQMMKKTMNQIMMNTEIMKTRIQRKSIFTLLLSYLNRKIKKLIVYACSDKNCKNLFLMMLKENLLFLSVTFFTNKVIE